MSDQPGPRQDIGELLASLGVSRLDEIPPGDETVWRPCSFKEWQDQERTKTFLNAWSKQMDHERTLRSRFTTWVLVLISVQLLAIFAIVFLHGFDVLLLDKSLANLMKVLAPSICVEVVGLGFVVAKYLFSEPTRKNLDALVRGTDNGN